jgi:hypothetical protein
MGEKGARIKGGIALEKNCPITPSTKERVVHTNRRERRAQHPTWTNMDDHFFLKPDPTLDRPFAPAGTKILQKFKFSPESAKTALSSPEHHAMAADVVVTQ